MAVMQHFKNFDNYDDDDATKNNLRQFFPLFY